MTTYPGILADITACPFLHPYLLRQLGEPDPAEPVPTRAAVRIAMEGAAAPDPDFEAECRRMGLPVLTLRCPAIIATGMTGLPRRIAAAIYRGTFVQIKANGARISVVHAEDVARAAAMAAGADAEYTITDGADPRIADLAEALAWRIDQKRLFEAPAWAAKLWLGRRFFDQLTTNHLLPNSFTEAYPDFKPTIVTEYLRTHVYDENSL